MTGFDWVLPSLTGFYWVLLGFTGFYWVFPKMSCSLSTCTGLGGRVYGLTGFYRVLLGFTLFYWVLLGFTGFYWVSVNERVCFGATNELSAVGRRL